MRFFILLTFALGVFDAAAQDPAAVGLPTHYEGYHFYLRPVTTAGDTLNLITDTGGNVFLAPRVAERAGLAVQATGQVVQGDSLYSAPLPAFIPEASIPALVAAEGQLSPLVAEGRLMLQPTSLLPPVMVEAFGMDAWDGMLGFDYFAGRSWTFDYGNGMLLHRPDGGLPPHDPAQHVTFDVVTDSTGARTANFLALDLVVAGDTLGAFFDTGAGMAFPDSTIALLDDGLPSFRGVTFVRTSVYERWRSAHPDWRVIERAGPAFLGASSMILVPEVTVGGATVGPSWFVERDDQGFDRFVAAFGRPIDVALGGSVLRHFRRVSVDYPEAEGVFEH